MTPIHVVGIGLDGVAGLSVAVRQIVEQAAVLAGSDRHLRYFPDHPAQRWPLSGLELRLQAHLKQVNPGLIVVLTSGDPLFFGLGRQLLQTLPPEAITFHPHVSAMQLAFSRAKLPWQEAALVSAHGRSLERLQHAVKAGTDLIAVLTDGVNTPGAIARFIAELALPTLYQLWVCENLGGADEQVSRFSLAAAQQASFAPLNVVILQRLESPLPLGQVPLLGIPDQAFLSFRDRPGLMTKREVRLQILGELALQPQQVIWDIGAGTGSVSIEVARLAPSSQVWAIEKTTAGCELIRQNACRFAVNNLQVVQGIAPAALMALPAPDRIFIGGSGGQLRAVLDYSAQCLHPEGLMVVALATLENRAEVTQWLSDRADWEGQFQDIALAKSTTVGPFTRMTPLNPITLSRLSPKPLRPDQQQPPRSDHQREI